MIKLVFLALFISTVFSKTTLYVQYSRKSNNFKTVQEAVNMAASINPRGEHERVTINIAPGLYREQVIINTPFITLKNGQPSKGTVTITWYYGMGYKYYSANSSGYYDADLAKKRSSKKTVSNWGATVQLWKKAQYFKASNIIFENSFNRYMTTEEIRDGVTVNRDTSSSSIIFQRIPSSNVRTREATERAAAITIEGAYTEFLSCKFYGSQNTLYTGVSPIFFKKCVIEGQTDYIFGTGNVVFDFCELKWKGYSGTSYPGYITSTRIGGGESISSYTGYLFNKCRIYGSSQNLNVTGGYLGRASSYTAKVTFINTFLLNGEIILPEGWYEMNGIKPEDVDGFKEYGTQLKDKTPIDLSKRKGQLVSSEFARTLQKIKYLNYWSPSYLNS